MSIYRQFQPYETESDKQISFWDSHRPLNVLAILCNPQWVNILRSYKMAAIFQTIFSDAFSWNENIWIAIKISLKFLPKGPINIIPALGQIMAWCRLSESHCLNQWWLIYWRVYASLGLNELKDALLNTKLQKSHPICLSQSGVAGTWFNKSLSDKFYHVGPQWQIRHDVYLNSNSLWLTPGNHTATFDFISIRMGCIFILICFVALAPSYALYSSIWACNTSFHNWIWQTLHGLNLFRKQIHVCIFSTLK